MSEPQSPSFSSSSRPNHEKVSRVLHDLTIGRPEEKLTFGDIREGLGDRSFGLLIFIFSLPNCIPIPGLPGIGLITALPIFFFALQLTLGRRYPYMPKWLSNRSFTRGQLSYLMVKSGSSLRWLERLIRPRFGFFIGGNAERFLGLILLFLAILISLPIPLGNLLPGVAVAFLALALIERDGLLVLIGYSLGAISCAWLLALVFGATEVLERIFHF